MGDFIRLLRANPNYRTLWFGQVISEVGDHFNTIAVFSLAMEKIGSGAVVAGVLIARAIATIAVAPIAGIVLDRMDRRTVMIISDLIRAVVAVGFILTIYYPRADLLYLLSALLMLASPFFSSGRAAILPALVSKEDLHTATAVTQTTQWTNTALGTFLGGAMVAAVGFETAFLFNALSFVISASCIYLLRPGHGSFKAVRDGAPRRASMLELREGWRYMKRYPLLIGITAVSIGWATGGGAAQVLFGLLGHHVFGRGAQGIGQLWGAAGVGLIVGGLIGHRLGKVITFDEYKRTISICYLIHGSFYVLCCISPSFALALVFIGISRAATAISSVLNTSRLLQTVDQAYRGRVFSTIDSLQWTVMLFSMAGAGWASEHYSARWIGVIAGILSSTTALAWWALNVTGRLPEPQLLVTEGDTEHAVA